MDLPVENLHKKPQTKGTPIEYREESLFVFQKVCIFIPFFTLPPEKKRRSNKLFFEWFRCGLCVCKMSSKNIQITSNVSMHIEYPFFNTCEMSRCEIVLAVQFYVLFCRSAVSFLFISCFHLFFPSFDFCQLGFLQIFLLFLILSIVMY